VSEASYTQSGSYGSDGVLQNKCVQAARKFRFAPLPGNDRQCGKVFFSFKVQ
jgi:DNA polymerase II large subunit